MLTVVCSKKWLTANTDLYLLQYERLRYLFSSLSVRGTLLLIQMNMCKCRVVRRGERNVQHVGTHDHRVLLLPWEDHVVVLYVPNSCHTIHSYRTL